MMTQHDQEEDDRHRRREVDVAALERGLVHVHHDRLERACGRAVRPAQHPQVAEAGHGVDDAGHDQEDEDRSQTRQRDVPPAGDRARAVHGGRVVQVPGHGLEPGEDDDHEVAEAGPDREDGDRGARAGERRARLGQPQRRVLDAQAVEDPVEQAPVGLEDVVEDERDGDRGGDLGQEVDDLERRREVPDAVHERCQHQRQREDDGQERHAQQDRVDDGVDEHLVVQQPGVVVEADEHLVPTVHLVQAQPEGVDGRPDHEQQEQGQRHGEQRVPGARSARCAGASSWEEMLNEGDACARRPRSGPRSVVMRSTAGPASSRSRVCACSSACSGVRVPASAAWSAACSAQRGPEAAHG